MPDIRYQLLGVPSPLKQTTQPAPTNKDTQWLVRGPGSKAASTWKKAGGVVAGGSWKRRRK